MMLYKEIHLRLGVRVQHFKFDSFYYYAKQKFCMPEKKNEK